MSNFYGQELNRTTYNLARMNMIMHDVHYRKFDIKQEDTLEHPPSILVFKKCREDSDCVIFIDASAHFEKVKNQNLLREKDYNLNIPRYVDTFEEEEAVDLGAVSAELKALDLEMKESDKIIGGFCDELGIERPF